MSNHTNMTFNDELGRFIYEVKKEQLVNGMMDRQRAEKAWEEITGFGIRGIGFGTQEDADAFTLDFIATYSALA